MNEKILKEAENVKEKTYDFDKHSFIVNSVFHENSVSLIFIFQISIRSADAGFQNSLNREPFSFVPRYSTVTQRLSPDVFFDNITR